jgi:hypothetical protein
VGLHGIISYASVSLAIARASRNRYEEKFSRAAAIEALESVLDAS